VWADVTKPCTFRLLEERRRKVDQIKGMMLRVHTWGRCVDKEK
jgi:hypothetical protein